MRRIAIINQKGGVGKTTTAVNLAAALAEFGQRVCVIDLDPQAHATTHLGIEPDGKAPSMYDVLVNSRPLAEVRRKVEDNLWVAGSDINLAAAEVELIGTVGRETILRDQLDATLERSQRLIERQIAALEPLDELLQLIQRLLEIRRLGVVGHGAVIHPRRGLTEHNRRHRVSSA